MGRTLLMLLSLMTAPWTVHASHADCGGSTPFVLTSRGGIAVPVTIDGRGPFRLLLDTGSTHSVVTERVAGGARTVATSILSSVSGRRMVAVVAFERFALGPYADPVMPSVVEGMPDDREGVDGIVGQDVLAGRSYTIDFRRRVIVWHQNGCGRGEPGSVALTLEPLDGRFIVRGHRGGREVRLVPDSAAEQFVLYASAPAPGSVPAGRLETLTGAERAWRTVVDGLRLGGVELDPIPAVALIRSVGHSGGVDGLLPLTMFERVTFNGPGRLLVLDLPPATASSLASTASRRP